MMEQTFIASLITQLDTDDESLRNETIDKLAQFGETAVEPLITALEHSQYRVSSGASKALAKIGLPAAEPLKVLLNHPGEQVRATAIRTLQRVQPLSFDALVDILETDKSYLSVPLAVLREIGSYAEETHDERAIQLLKEYAFANHLDFARYALWGLASIDKEAAMAMLEQQMFKHENYCVRRNAVEISIYLEDERVIPFLLEALVDEEFAVNLPAILSLQSLQAGGKPVPNISTYLIDKTRDKNPVIRSKAAFALGHFGNDEALNRLCFLLLNDPIADVRMNAARGLEALGDLRSEDALVHARQDTSGTVKHHVEAALTQLNQVKKFNRFAADLQNGNDEAAYALSQFSGGLEILIEALRKGSKAAARALISIQNPRATKALTEALKDERVQTEAHYALEQKKRFRR